MRCHAVVPTPLRLADELQHGCHLGFGSALLPSKLSLDVGMQQLILELVAHLIDLALAFIDVLPERFLALAVAHLAGAVDVLQRAGDVVIGVLDATFRLVRHVAVGASYAALRVNALLSNLILRVLRLEDGCAAEGVDVVVVVRLVIVGLGVLHRHALVPREGEVLAFTLEVILHVALGADERAHLLRGGLGDVLALALESLDQRGTGDLQIHRLRVVTVAAANRVHDLGTHRAPRCFVEVGNTHLVHHAGHVGAFTCPARGRLDVALAVYTGVARAEDGAHVFDGMLMAAGRIVFAREGVASPKDDHLWPCSQHIDGVAAIELGREGGVLRLCPSLVFARIVEAPDLVARLELGDVGLLVVVNRCNLGAPLGDGCG